MINTKGIEAKEIQVKDLFSSKFIFGIPIYQRPFSWNSDNFAQLFDDVSDARDSGEQQYFLGSGLFISLLLIGIVIFIIATRVKIHKRKVKTKSKIPKSKSVSHKAFYNIK